MSFRSTRTNVLFFAVFLLIPGMFCSFAAADTITVTAMDAGFVTEAGGSAKGDSTIFPPAALNYSVGQELHFVDGALGSSTVYMDRNNYFIFDVSTITETIKSASIVMAAGELESVDFTETFHLVAPVDPGMAMADAAMLAAGVGMGTMAFDDPGDPLIGVAAGLYGNIEDGAMLILATGIISSDDDDTIIEISFDPLGIDYLNMFAGSGPVFLGGTVSTIMSTDMAEQPFGGTGPLSPDLVIETIPEPGSVGLVAIISGLIVFRRNRLAAA